jgi:WD40 repeat protein
MILLEGRKQDVDALVFSPDGKLLAVGGSASHVQLWDLETRTARRVLGPKGEHRAVAFLPGGGIMTATSENAIRFEALTPSGLPRREVTPGGTYPGGSTYIHAVLAPAGDSLVVCGQRLYTPLLTCFDLEDMTNRWTRTGRDVGEQPFRLCPCPDGRLAVATSHRTYLIDPGTGSKVEEMGGHMDFVPAVTVSRDGTLLACAAGMDLALYRLDTAARTASTRVPGRKQFTDVAFHPTGRWLLASSNDQTVRVYDLSLKEVTTFDWEVGPVRRVAFSPDGMQAAAAGKTGKVALWDFDL